MSLSNMNFSYKLLDKYFDINKKIVLICKDHPGSEIDTGKKRKEPIKIPGRLSQRESENEGKFFIFNILI